MESLVALSVVPDSVKKISALNNYRKILCLNRFVLRVKEPILVSKSEH